MSSPTPSTSGSNHGDLGANPAPESVSALALSGLLKVQRRWSLNSNPVENPQALNELSPSPSRASPEIARIAARARLPVHLEDSKS
jgi:hypothetical protein